MRVGFRNTGKNMLNFGVVRAAGGWNCHFFGINGPARHGEPKRRKDTAGFPGPGNRSFRHFRFFLRGNLRGFVTPRAVFFSMDLGSRHDWGVIIPKVTNVTANLKPIPPE